MVCWRFIAEGIAGGIVVSTATGLSGCAVRGIVHTMLDAMLEEMMEAVPVLVRCCEAPPKGIA